MSKQRIKTSVLERELLTTFNQTRNFIFNKYYNLFMNKLGVEGADYQQRDFLLRQFWTNGTIAMFIMKGTIGSTEAPQGLPVFCPYAPITYNIYDWPIDATLINRKGVNFIPTTPQRIDKDIVIGFIQRNHKGLKDSVDYYARKIALINSVIQTQLLAKKMPFIFPVTPETKAYFESLWNDILSDNPKLFVEVASPQDINVLNTNTSFDIDKLKALADDYENELREILGVNNLGVHEKKEHLITSEIEANDETTKDNASCIIDTLEEFSEQAKKVFNYDLKFTWKDSIEMEEKEEKDAPEDELEEEEESED